MADIDSDEAFRRAVKSFYEGAGFEEMEKASGSKIKHNKEFFDGYEKELRKGKKISKKPKEEELEEVEEEEDI